MFLRTEIMISNVMQKSEQNTNYPNFGKTYATLRIYHDKITPEEITQSLDILPADCQMKK